MSADPLPKPTADAGLSLDSRAITRVLLWCALALNLANAVTVAVLPQSDNGKWLYLGNERNPSTWFSSAQLMLAAALAYGTSRARPDRREWNLVAVLLVVMSVDETATVHEKLGGLPGIPHIGSRAWVGAGLVVVVLVAARLLPWALLRLEPHLRTGLLAGAALFLAGAVGLESLAGVWHDGNGEDRVFWALSALEENVELLGVFVVVLTLLQHARTSGAQMRLRVTG